MLSKKRLKGSKGEFFPFFRRKTPRPPYGADRPSTLDPPRNMLTNVKKCVKIATPALPSTEVRGIAANV